MDTYFVYTYTDPSTKETFYVGRGKNKRHLDHLRDVLNNRKCVKSKKKFNKIKEIVISGIFPEINKIEENLSFEESIISEKKWIKFYGRKDLGEGSLLNLTDGGEGPTNVSPEIRKMQSNRLKNKVACIDTKTNKVTHIKKDLLDYKRYLPLNHGKSLYTNGKDNKILSPDHPLVISGEFYRPNKGKCNVIIDGNHVMVSIEEKNKNGYKSMNKNMIAVVDIEGNKFTTNTDDIRIKNGELTVIVGRKINIKEIETGKMSTIDKGEEIPKGYVGLNKGGCKNLLTLSDFNGNLYRVNKNDPRVAVSLFGYKKKRNGDILPIIPDHIFQS